MKSVYLKACWSCLGVPGGAWPFLTSSGPFPTATRVWKGCTLLADEGVCSCWKSSEHSGALWPGTTGTLNWCPLQLGPRNRFRYCQSGSQLEQKRTQPALWKLAKTGNSRYVEVRCAFYLSEPWECRTGYFWKLGWELLLQTRNKSKWALWFKAAFDWSASLGILKIDTLHISIYFLEAWALSVHVDFWKSLWKHNWTWLEHRSKGYVEGNPGSASEERSWNNSPPLLSSKR